MNKLAFARKHLTSIVLSVAAIGAVGYLIADQGSLTTDEANRRKSNLFLAWRHDDIKGLRVKSPAGSYELVRKEVDGQMQWRLRGENGDTDAEEQSVDQFLGTLQYATFSRKLSDGAAAESDTGLGSPILDIEVDMGPLRHHLTVGGEIATGEGHYAAVEGRGVFVVSKALVAALTVPSQLLRTKDFVPHLSVDLAKLTIEHGDTTLAFERATWSGGRGSGFWFGPEAGALAKKRVDAAPLDQVFVAFGRMQAQTFLDEPVAEKAASTQVTITMTTHTGTTSKLTLGGACPDKPGLMVARRSGAEPLSVCVPQGLLGAFTKQNSDFVDDGVLGASEDEISEVLIQKQDQTLEFVRSGLAYKQRKPQERDIEQPAGDNFLEDLVMARGKLDDSAEFDADQPQTRVRVISIGGLGPDGKTVERIEEVSVGSARGGGMLAVRKEDGAKVVLGDLAAAAFTTNDLVLREPTVLSLDPTDVTSLTVSNKLGQQKVRQEGAVYILESPQGNGLEADTALSAELYHALAKLRAERWVGAVPSPSFGFDKPRASLTLVVKQTDDSEKTFKLLIGERTDDGAFAKLADKPEVFVVPRRFDDATQKYLISRSSYFVPTEVMAGIKISGSERALQLVRDGKQLKVEGDSPLRGSDLAQALGRLMPLDVTSVGKEPTTREGLAEPVLTIEITLRKLPEDPPDAPTRVVLVIGAQDSLAGAPIFFSRRQGIDATFALPAEPVRTLLAATGR